MTNDPPLEIIYTFVNEEDAISNRDRRDVPKILAIDALVTVKIAGDIYFQEEIAVLEFYKALYQWRKQMTNTDTQKFDYFSIENDQEEGPILSLLPFANKARVKTIWPLVDVYNVFELVEAVKVFCELEESLKAEIERYFGIELKRFLKHIPYYFPLNND